MALINKLTAIADAIRAKTKKSGSLTLDQMVTEIQGIEIDPDYQTPTIEVSSGGLITASANGKSGTKQLTTQAGGTTPPTESVQTIVTSGKYTTGDVKVGAISSTYVGSGVTRQAAKAVTPNSTTQTAVASGSYTTGNVTVSPVPTETKSAVTPTKSSQTISATTGKYFTSLSVNAIPDQYIVPSGSETKTANGTYDVTKLAELVVNVSGGGGGGAKVEHGTATLSGTNLLTINHSLGKKPDFICVWNSETGTNSQKTHNINYDSGLSTTTARYQYYRSGAYITKNVSNTKNSTSYVYMDTSVITLPYYSSTYTFSGTYYYIIGTYS